MLNENSRGCIDCPNVVLSSDTERQKQLYGVATGMTSCASRGVIIGLPQMRSTETDESARDIAAHCPQYGVRSHEEVTDLRIGIGNPPTSGGTQLARSCRACFFHVAAQEAVKKTGVPIGLCTKYGRLIPDQRASIIAKDCRMAVRNNTDDPETHNKELLETFTVTPHLEKYIVLESGQSVSLRDAVDTSIEPTQYTSDRPVTAQQDAAGIRAWRRITHGKREVFLPIFKREFFDTIEQAKIPATGDDEHPEKYVDHMGMTFTVAALWFHLDETPALSGKAGTGKTEFFRYMAWLMQIPFERVSITRDSEIEDLAGKFHLENDETVFKPGRIPKAWVKPNVLVLDEPNTGPPEVWQYIRPLTDNSKQLVNDKNEGETIKRHSFAFLGMAMNPAWDARNVGAEQIGDADGSRLMHIYVDMPPEEIERDILKERCEIDGYEIEDSMIESIMSIAKNIRELSDNGELPITWGVRNQIKVARATAWFSMQEAYKLAVLDYLEPETKEMLMEIVNNEIRVRR